jgi:hypothetical protein
VSKRIEITCLSCGHQSSIADDALTAFGIEPGTSLVTLTKRLVCGECGSGSVRAERHLSSSEGPSILPPEPPLKKL